MFAHPNLYYFKISTIIIHIYSLPFSLLLAIISYNSNKYIQIISTNIIQISFEYKLKMLEINKLYLFKKIKLLSVN